MATWYKADEAGAERIEKAWKDAPLMNLELTDFIFETAREQVLAYAPDGDPAAQVTELLRNLGVEETAITQVLALLDFEATTAAVPIRYVYAQLQQARNLWLAGRTDQNGDIGGDYSFTPRPLDKTIRDIIRPVDGTPHAL